MFAEQIGPYGVVAGLAFIALAIVAALFATDFPLTGPVKQLRAYPLLAGAYVTFTAFAALILGVVTAALIFNLSGAP